MRYGTKIHFSTYKREKKKEACVAGEAKYPRSFHGMEKENPPSSVGVKNMPKRKVKFLH